MGIYRFLQFIKESKTENIKLEVSKELKYILYGIGDVVANSIISSVNGNKADFDLTAIDITDNPDIVSFITASKWHKLDNKEDAWTKNRSEIKIGRLINKVSGGSFTSKQIEDFVNSYKAAVSKDKFESFEIVSGEDLVYWYNCKNYVDGGGTLNSSCMKNAKFLDLYEKNPDVIKMVIKKDGDKISGRALLWEVKISGLHNDPVLFMDRIYTRNDHDVNIFKEYAEKNGWIYKKVQDFRSNGFMYNGVNRSFYIYAEIQSGDYDYYPYLDTLKYYNSETGIITNDSDHDHDHELNSTDGGSEYTGVTRVYDEYSGEYIDEDDAVWCDHARAYCNRDDAVYLEYNNEYAFPNHVKRSLYDGEYYLEKDLVWSDYHKSYIYFDSSVKVINSIDGEYDWMAQDYVDNSDEITYVDSAGDYYMKDLVYLDIDGFYISKTDSDTLKVKYDDKSNKYIIDKSGDVYMNKNTYILQKYDYNIDLIDKRKKELIKESEILKDKYGTSKIHELGEDIEYANKINKEYIDLKYVTDLLNAISYSDTKAAYIAYNLKKEVGNIGDRLEKIISDGIDYIVGTEDYKKALNGNDLNRFSSESTKPVFKDLVMNYIPNMKSYDNMRSFVGSSRSGNLSSKYNLDLLIGLYHVYFDLNKKLVDKYREDPYYDRIIEYNKMMASR